MKEIIMPRLGVNDDLVTIVKWLVKNGDYVQAGQEIAEIETSKESGSIEASEAGVIHFKTSEGMDVRVGSVVAIIGEEIFQDNSTPVLEIEKRITEKAQRLIAEYNIDENMLPSDRIIRERDILDIIKKDYQIEEVISNKVLVYGGGNLGKVIVEILKSQHQFELYGIIDSNYPERKSVLGISVLGNDDNLEEIYKKGYNKIINAIGFNEKKHWRKPPYEMLKSIGFEFYNVIHKDAVIEASARVGVGNLICAAASVGTEAIIGNNCILNTGSVISHDCIISDHCHIASGAVLGGAVIVGENSLIGQNCSIFSDITVGKNVVIQNGCNVFRNVPDNVVVKENWW